MNKADKLQAVRDEISQYEWQHHPYGDVYFADIGPNAAIIAAQFNRLLEHDIFHGVLGHIRVPGSAVQQFGLSLPLKVYPQWGNSVLDALDKSWDLQKNPAANIGKRLAFEAYQRRTSAI